MRCHKKGSVLEEGQNGNMDEERFSIMRNRLMDSLEMYREIQDEEIYRKIDELILENGTGIRLAEREHLRRELFNSVRRLDILQELVDDNSVTEIMINGTDGIFIERDGRLIRWDRQFGSTGKLEDLVQQIVAKCNRIVNESSPIVDARLDNGARVNIVMPPVALNGPVITIRRFPDQPIRMDQLIRWGAVSEEAACFLKNLVRSGYNLFISGGTGSGKTTFMNALSAFIPSDERIITIEDNAELQIQGISNLVRMEARNANAAGELAVTIRDLIRSSLRMRPDRILIGEVRGSEVIDLLQALNTGHDGSISTGHANSPQDMLARLETMVLMGMEIPLPAIRRQIASGIDIIIHLGRLRDKSRKVLEIIELLGYDSVSGEIQTETLYEFEEEGTDEQGRIQGELKKRAELHDRRKLLRAGIDERDG
jgi:pilus assembly protein CpaF